MLGRLTLAALLLGAAGAAFGKCCRRSRFNSRTGNRLIR